MSASSKDPIPEGGGAGLGAPAPLLLGRDASRDDVARYLLAHGEIVRARVQRRLRATGIRSLDPEDILSSVLRRVDLSMLRGVLRTESEREFWAYVHCITDNLVATHARAGSREGALDAAAVDGAATRPDRASHMEEATAKLRELIESLPSSGDREMVEWKLRGTRYEVIADETRRSPAAIRQHWSKLRRLLRGRRFPGME